MKQQQCLVHYKNNDLQKLKFVKLNLIDYLKINDNIKKQNGLLL